MKTGIIFSILFTIMAVGSFAAEGNTFTYKVGKIEVTLLVETRGEGRSTVLVNPDQALLQRYLPGGTYKSETNTFLVKTPDKTILVDTGFGTTLFDNLKSLGVSPDKIDAVLITHMHGDHIGGLQKDGKALFPKAKVYLAAKEKDYWTNPDTIAKLPENQRRSFLAAVAALAPYGNNVQTFTPGELGAQIQDLIPGIKPIAAYGHTPGHTMFMVNSEGKQLLIWADLVHVQDIQIPVPGQSVTYDSDPAAAANIRTKVLEYVSRNSIPIAGMHLQYPGIANIKAAGGGSYSLTPVQ